MRSQVIPGATMTTCESPDTVTWGRGKACAQTNETKKKKKQKKQTCSVNNACENYCSLPTLCLILFLSHYFGEKRKI